MDIETKEAWAAWQDRLDALSPVTATRKQLEALLEAAPARGRKKYPGYIFLQGFLLGAWAASKK